MLHYVPQPVTNSPCLPFVAMQVVCSRLVLEIFSAEKTLENDTAESNESENETKQLVVYKPKN